MVSIEKLTQHPIPLANYSSILTLCKDTFNLSYLFHLKTKYVKMLYFIEPFIQYHMYYILFTFGLCPSAWVSECRNQSHNSVWARVSSILFFSLCHWKSFDRICWPEWISTWGSFKKWTLSLSQAGPSASVCLRLKKFFIHKKWIIFVMVFNVHQLQSLVQMWHSIQLYSIEPGI